MIVDKMFHNVRCDHCGALLDEDTWSDDADALRETVLPECGWIECEGRHYCDKCWHYDDDDNIVTADGRKWTDLWHREIGPAGGKDPDKPAIAVGSWMVAGMQTCRVAEIRPDTVVLEVPSALFGPIRRSCNPEDVRPWTLEDAMVGDYLTQNIGDHKIVYITHGHPAGVFESFAGYSTRFHLFWRDETCCSDPDFRGCIHPATAAEKLLLDDQIAAHGLHWNLDRQELEDKVDMSGLRARSTEGFALLQQDINDLQGRIRTLEERVGFLETRDMPLGGDGSCI